jgi:enediyne biosynthesis protein E4
VPAPGRVDNRLGEFWVENPWAIIEQGHNLSAYERKRAYLNVQGNDFLDVSFLTGADNDGDGRSVVAGDFRNNGQLDLVLRQVGGGPVLLYENQFPRRHYLKVSLRGTRSNRLGIGARLTAKVENHQLVREMYPLNSYRSQMPNIIHLGLGDAERVAELRIRWPSGQEQVLTNLAGDRHILVEEGKEGDGAVETIEPGKTLRP